MIEVSKEWLRSMTIKLSKVSEEELKILLILIHDELQRRDFYLKAKIIKKDLSVFS
jgi:hypothetical protein